MTIKRRKSAAAVTLIEVMVAVLIVTIVMIGGSLLFVTGRSQINQQKHRRAAVQLAAQKLEELKAGDYDAITIGDTEESLSLEDLSYSRSTHAEDASSYKDVTVTVSWGPTGNEHNVSLVTSIAPK
jgi:Tfp pilus assembly protein PilV